MIRINYPRQIGHFIAFVIFQLPLLYKFILFNSAFGFFYVGFILLLPLGLNRNWAMIVAILTGLLIDIFSNTPGIHAAACVFIAFTKDYWYMFSMGEIEDQSNLSWNDLKMWGSIRFLFPLIFAHHMIIFAVENGGLMDFFFLFKKIIFSSIYTFITVFGIILLLAPKERRQ